MPTLHRSAGSLRLNSGPLLSYGKAAHPPGQSTPRWRAEAGAWNIAYTLSGTVQEILPQGEAWERPHDLMLLKPGGAHGWKVPADASVPWCVVWFVFVPRPDWLPLLDLPEEFSHFSRLPLAGRPCDGKVRRALLQAHRFACMPEGRLLCMNAIERALLFLDAEFGESRSQFDPRVRAAMQLFMRRLADPPSLKEAATACGISVSRLGELFLASTGQTPMLWLEHRRLDHARDMLATTGLPIKLVAAACGYQDQRHFATRFRKHIGCQPSECRRHMRQAHDLRQGTQ